MITGKEGVQTRWLISTILRYLGNTGAVKGQSSTTTVVASVVSVLLVLIVGAVAGVIFWRRYKRTMLIRPLFRKVKLIGNHPGFQGLSTSPTRGMEEEIP